MQALELMQQVPKYRMLTHTYLENGLVTRVCIIASRSIFFWGGGGVGGLVDDVRV